jgi:hypothetical protein
VLTDECPVSYERGWNDALKAALKLCDKDDDWCDYAAFDMARSIGVEIIKLMKGEVNSG